MYIIFVKHRTGVTNKRFITYTNIFQVIVVRERRRFCIEYKWHL